MSAFILKFIACAAMFIDHLAVGLAHADIISSSGELYVSLRCIGRIAFPIYGFLIAEGAKHTKCWWKYLFRLVLLALLSEVPFDLALWNGSFWQPAHQNVFITLSLGLCTVLVIRFAFGQTGKMKFPGFLLAVGVTAAAALLNQFILKADYGASGIVMIAVMGIYEAPLYELRFKLMNQEQLIRLIFAGTAIMLLAIISRSQIEYFALLALLPIWLYNGEKGYNSKALKWGFYLFYPAHLMLIRLGLMAFGY